MAKLVKSNEEQNTWLVLDDNCINCDKVGATYEVVSVAGSTDTALINTTRPTKDDEMLELGTVWFGGGCFVFIPETDNGVEHTAVDLREIADLMDGLEKAQAATA
jgi:hypothetical protein